MTNPPQQNALLCLLNEMEERHAWPTLWIVNALKREWKLDI